MSKLLITLVLALLLAFQSESRQSSSPSSANSQASSPLSPLYFVTDFDGTIAHYKIYEASSQSESDIVSPTPPSSGNDPIALPASSGSGKIAYISQSTIDLLQEISRDVSDGFPATAMICASGQRVTTMMQRRASLPFFHYWISENGGRIHNGDMSELDEYTMVSNRLNLI